eukprot:PhF_6_TR7991/c0_g1_i1/m.12266
MRTSALRVLILLVVGSFFLCVHSGCQTAQNLTYCSEWNNQLVGTCHWNPTTSVDTFALIYSLEYPGCTKKWHCILSATCAFFPSDQCYYTPNNTLSSCVSECALTKTYSVGPKGLWPPVARPPVPTAPWIDPATPTSALRKNISNVSHVLVFSDEFVENSSRSFEYGHDAKWDALTHWYSGTGDDECYVPEGATLRNGSLYISLENTIVYDMMTNKQCLFRSAMLQTWNKFCFTGGFVDVKVQQPGTADYGGLWSAVFMLGNLCRAGFEASTEGLWPYTYSQCDAAAGSQDDWFPKVIPRVYNAITQTYTNGTPSKGLSGQTYSSCRTFQDVPQYNWEPYVARGCPEIDVFELIVPYDKASWVAFRNPTTGAFITQSLQLGPKIPMNTRHGGGLTGDCPGDCTTKILTEADGLKVTGENVDGPTCCGTVHPAYYYCMPGNRNQGVCTGLTYNKNVGNSRYNWWCMEPDGRLGNSVQDCVSVEVDLNSSHFETFHNYQLEWVPQNKTNPRTTFFMNEQVTFSATAAGLTRKTNPLNTTQTTGQRDVPTEPMYLILNVATSQSNFQPRNPSLKFPSSMIVDYVRVYQPEGDVNVGCDPAKYKTADYIRLHSRKLGIPMCGDGVCHAGECKHCPQDCWNSIQCKHSCTAGEMNCQIRDPFFVRGVTETQDSGDDKTNLWKLRVQNVNYVNQVPGVRFSSGSGSPSGIFYYDTIKLCSNVAYRFTVNVTCTNLNSIPFSVFVKDTMENVTNASRSLSCSGLQTFTFYYSGRTYNDVRVSISLDGISSTSSLTLSYLQLCPLQSTDVAGLCNVVANHAPTQCTGCECTPCFHAGTCVATLCVCLPGFSGPRCEIAPFYTVGSNQVAVEDVDFEATGINGVRYPVSGINYVDQGTWSYGDSITVTDCMVACLSVPTCTHFVFDLNDIRCVCGNLGCLCLGKCYLKGLDLSTCETIPVTGRQTFFKTSTNVDCRVSTTAQVTTQYYPRSIGRSYGDVDETYSVAIAYPTSLRGYVNVNGVTYGAGVRLSECSLACDRSHLTVYGGAANAVCDHFVYRFLDSASCTCRKVAGCRCFGDCYLRAAKFLNITDVFCTASPPFTFYALDTNAQTGAMTTQTFVGVGRFPDKFPASVCGQFACGFLPTFTIPQPRAVTTGKLRMQLSSPDLRENVTVSGNTFTDVLSVAQQSKYCYSEAFDRLSFRTSYQGIVIQNGSIVFRQGFPATTVSYDTATLPSLQTFSMTLSSNTSATIRTAGVIPCSVNVPLKLQVVTVGLPSTAQDTILCSWYMQGSLLASSTNATSIVVPPFVNPTRVSVSVECSADLFASASTDVTIFATSQDYPVLLDVNTTRASPGDVVLCQCWGSSADIMYEFVEATTERSLGQSTTSFEWLVEFTNAKTVSLQCKYTSPDGSTKVASNLFSLSIVSGSSPSPSVIESGIMAMGKSTLPNDDTIALLQYYSSGMTYVTSPTTTVVTYLLELVESYSNAQRQSLTTADKDTYAVVLQRASALLSTVTVATVVSVTNSMETLTGTKVNLPATTSLLTTGDTLLKLMRSSLSTSLLTSAYAFNVQLIMKQLFRTARMYLTSALTTSDTAAQFNYQGTQFVLTTSTSPISVSTTTSHHHRDHTAATGSQCVLGLFSSSPLRSPSFPFVSFGMWFSCGDSTGYNPTKVQVSIAGYPVGTEVYSYDVATDKFIWCPPSTTQTTNVLCDARVSTSPPLYYAFVDGTSSSSLRTKAPTTPSPPSGNGTGNENDTTAPLTTSPSPPVSTPPAPAPRNATFTSLSFLEEANAAHLSTSVIIGIIFGVVGLFIVCGFFLYMRHVQKQEAYRMTMQHFRQQYAQD